MFSNIFMFQKKKTFFFFFSWFWASFHRNLIKTTRFHRLVPELANKRADCRFGFVTPGSSVVFIGFTIWTSAHLVHHFSTLCVRQEVACWGGATYVWGRRGFSKGKNPDRRCLTRWTLLRGVGGGVFQAPEVNKLNKVGLNSMDSCLRFQDVFLCNFFFLMLDFSRFKSHCQFWSLFCLSLN